MKWMNDNDLIFLIGLIGLYISSVFIIADVDIIGFPMLITSVILFLRGAKN